MISWVLPSSILIVVLIGLRRLLKGKISLRLQYALWGLVLLRLLVPFSFGGSRLSVMNTAEKIPAVQVMDRVKDIGNIGQTEVGGGEGSVSQG
ncbi:MAG: M56 family metallopeptidase, partial [Bacillota bacterium]